MSIQKTTLAAALLLALTACSSGGKNNTDYLESQVKNLQNKAELAQKKAEQATKRAEDAEKKAKDLANSANAKLSEEVKNLKAEATKAKEQAEQAKKAAENALNNVDQSVKNALDNAEKERVAKEKAKDANIKKLTKIAKQDGAFNPEYLARNKSELTEEEFKDFLKKRKENYKILKDQALKAGFAEWVAHNFAVDNQDKEKSESDEELAMLKAQAEKERKQQAERETKRKELEKLATENGLEEWQANNFANEFQDKTVEEAKAELKKRKDEAVARENKRNELIKLATDNGLEDWQANNFANAFQDKTVEEAKANLVKRKEFKALAEEKGLEEQEAKEFAQNNEHIEREDAVKKLDEQIQEKAIRWKRQAASTITIETPIGFTGNFAKEVIPVFDEKGFDTGKTKLNWSKDIYNQLYSVLVGQYQSSAYEGNRDYGYYEFEIDGLRTREKNLPTIGKATYQGVAFTHNKQGQLTYDVDFAKKEGQGSITGLADIGTLTLEKDKIGKRSYSMGISGNVVAELWKDGVKGLYSLDFYGPKAEEIVGTATLIQDSISLYGVDGKPTSLDKLGTRADINFYESPKRLKVGFGGTRGEIQK